MIRHIRFISFHNDSATLKKHVQKLDDILLNNILARLILKYYSLEYYNERESACQCTAIIICVVNDIQDDMSAWLLFQAPSIRQTLKA